MQIVAKNSESHIAFTFLGIFITGVGVLVSLFLIYTFMDGFNTAKKSEVGVPAYNPPQMTMRGKIIANLEGGKGYAIHGVSTNGIIVEAVAFYPDGRMVNMSGNVLVSGKFLENNCEYKSIFGGHCVPYIEIDKINNITN